MRTVATVLLSALAAFGVASCGDDDDSGGADRDSLVDAVAESLGVERDTAECLADGLIGEIGEDRLRDFVEVDQEPTAEESAAVIQVLSDCDVPLE